MTHGKEIMPYCCKCSDFFCFIFRKYSISISLCYLVERKSFFYLHMSKSSNKGYGSGNTIKGDAPERSSTLGVEVETTSSSSSSLGGDSSYADLSPSTRNIRVESMFRSVGFTSGEDLAPLASISQDGSSANVRIEVSQSVVSPGPD